MAFAPHTNCQRPENAPRVMGQFREADTDNFFEYTDMNGHRSPFPGFDHRVFVGPNGETRYARILKTVAYIVTDEAEDGTAITEKWAIKAHRTYTN